MRSRGRSKSCVAKAPRIWARRSPELFLEFGGPRLRTKPMKGTASLDRIDELEQPKNRAEHVMIVDLLRNDLHRVCENVTVERFLEIERYPTYATMTSTIAGTPRPNVRPTKPFALLETFAADADDATLALHLRRLLRSAGAFGIVVDEPALRTAIGEARAGAAIVRARVNPDGSIDVSAEAANCAHEPLCRARRRALDAAAALRRAAGDFATAAPRSGQGSRGRHNRRRRARRRNRICRQSPRADYCGHWS